MANSVPLPVAPDPQPSKQRSVSVSNKPFRSLSSRIFIVLTVVALLVVLATSLTGIFLRRAALLKEFQDLTRSIAATGALGVDGASLELITTNADVEEPEFRVAHDWLEKIRVANSLKESEIYILRPLDLEKGLTEFVVMVDAKPFVGNQYVVRPENRAVFNDVLQTGTPGSTRIYEDAHGTWISSFAPVKDAEGKPVAVLEVDAEISRYVTKIYQDLALEVAVGAGVFLFALFPGSFLVRRLTSSLVRLTEAMNRFDAEKGEMEVVKIESRDEVEILATSFNQMTSKLHASTHSLVEANRSLAQSNAEIVQKTEELNRAFTITATIMATVQEGLFLLTDEGLIEPNYSAALETILAKKEMAGTRFLDGIRTRITAKDYELTERFLKLLFNPTKTNHMIPRLNPLKEVEITIQEADGRIIRKHLTFLFERVWDGKELKKALVTVQDVTARVNLTRDLKDSAAKMERQAELLFGVIHVRPAILGEFIADTRLQLAKVDAALKEETDTSITGPARQTLIKGKVTSIQREIHRVKGNAAMLRIDYFENAAHQLEDKLERLQKSPTVDGKDFIPLVLELSEISQRLGDMEDVVQRISSTYGTGTEAATPQTATPSAAASSMESGVAELVKNLATKMGKEVRVDWNAAELEKLSPDLKKPVRDVLIQLSRNSMAHGLESAAARTTAGKSPVGTLQISAILEKGWLRIGVQDDGRGLDYEAIIRRAQEMAATDPDIINSLVDYEKGEWRIEALNAMIMRPGFSTAVVAGLDAGRGVGLDLVKKQAEDLGGNFQIVSSPGTFCQFIVDLPYVSPLVTAS